MLRKLCYFGAWIWWLALPEVGSAISGNSCSVTINGTIGTPISMFTACSTISVFTNPNINFVSGTPMPPGMLITKSSSSGGNATWQVSGTPTEAGAGSAVYSFTDSNSGAVTMSISYSILGPVVPAATFVMGTVGRPYPAVTATATGGTGSGYSFLVGAGSLPTGLSLSSAGLLSGTASTAGTFNFSIQATDSGSNAGSSSFAIVINPAVSMASTASLSRTMGQSYSSAYAATGGTAPVTYAITGGSPPAGATLSAGSGLLSGVANGASTGSFTITATDAYGSTSSTVVSYQVSPVPSIAMTTPGGIVGTPYSQPLVFTGAISSAALSTGALPGGLSLTGGGTAVSGTPTAAGTFSFSLSGTDSNGISTSANFSISISASLTITTNSVPDAAIGAAYAATIAATGGAAPIAFSIAGGSLPTGLTLSQAGLLSGTPSAAGLATFTVAATDSQSNSTSRSFTLTVTATPIQISTSTLPSAPQGSPYLATVQASGGSGLLSYSVTAGALPSGITLSAGGSLSGTPTLPGIYNFTVTVMDSFGGSASVSLSIEVSSPPIVFSTITLPAASVGLFYSAGVAATGGAGSLTMTIQSGALPAGLQLAADGQITGTATVPAVYTFVVRASDAFNNASTRSYSIAVISPISITSASSLSPTTVGAPVNFGFTASGGTAPLAWTVSGTLPPGVIFTNGNLSGSPNLAGSYSFGVQVVDANGASASLELTQLVNPALSIGNTHVGGPYSRNGSMSVALIPVGGTAPFEWTVALGALPAGVTLNRETGRLSGGFMNLGSFAFSIRLRDQAGASVIRAFTISITNGPQFAPVTLPAATANHTYRFALEVFSTLPIVDWRVATPPETFPPGLRLFDGEIAGTPTGPGVFEFELNIRDQGGSSAAERFTLLINPPLELGEMKISGIVPRGKAYSWVVPRFGGTAPYRFRLLNGNLPAGLQLNAATGEISGTALNSGTFNFTVGAMDANQATASRLYTLSSGQGFLILSEALPTTLLLGSDVRIPIQTEGGVAPIDIQLSEGALPEGLALQESLIVGNPTSAGIFSVNFRATDATGAEAVFRWNFSVTEGIEVHPRSLGFTQISGTLLSIPHTLKWGSAPNSSQVRITTTAAWLRTSTVLATAPGSVEVWVEPTMLSAAFSSAEVILESGTASTRVPVQVEQLRSDPGNWWIEAATVQGGGWVALLRAESDRMPFEATLDSAGSSAYRLSEASGETQSGDAFLLWLEPTQSGAVRGAATLKVTNRITSDEQILELPESTVGAFELSAAYIPLRGQSGATLSNRSSLIVRSTLQKAFKVAGLSSEPWLQVQSSGGPAAKEQILRFQAKIDSLPAGIHEAMVDLYNQDGVKFDQILVQLEIQSVSPQVELSTNSFTLQRDRPMQTLQLFNPGKDPVAYQALTTTSALQLQNGQGWIAPGADVTISVSATSDGFSSWSRHRIHILIGGSRVELVEVDLAASGNAEGCQSNSPVLSMLSPGPGFLAKPDVAVEFRIAIRNTCGESIPGSVMTVRIPGFGPLHLYSGPDGVWYGTWIPTEAVESLQIEAIWLDQVNRRSVNRYVSGSVAP